MLPLERGKNTLNLKVADTAINISTFLVQGKSKIAKMLDCHEYVISGLLTENA